ncbi:MAG: flagellar motor protein MotB [Defluviitaleaceae bacterium]|nr:flagellar motor protein MotB [Defluviitaleaceae bacterium]
MARRKKKEEGGGQALWLLSYSDLMTVLFALFVMLYALSDVDEELWERLVIAASFGNNIPAPTQFSGEGINDLMGNGIMTLPDFNTLSFERPVQGGDGQQQNQMEFVAEQLRTYFAYYLMVGDHVEVEIGEHGEVIISAHGDMYFDSGQATIRPEVMPILEAIAMALNELRGTVNVSVEGHTDNVPMRGSIVFPDNRMLGAGRARAVANLMIYTFQVVDPEMVTVVSHGEHRPVADNATPEGRQQNRRVEIILTQVN